MHIQVSAQCLRNAGDKALRCATASDPPLPLVVRTMSLMLVSTIGGPMDRSWLVVIGASAGGLDALSRLVSALPADFPATLFIVQHMPADANGEALRNALTRSGNLKCTDAHDGEAFK